MPAFTSINPFGSEIDLTELASSVSNLISFTKVWEYETPADLSGATDYTIDCSGLSVPTIDFNTKEYLLKISGVSAISSIDRFTLFGASSNNIFTLAGSSAGTVMSNFKGTFKINGYTRLLATKTGTPLFIHYLLNENVTTNIYIAFTTERTIPAGLKFEIYERSLQ